MQFMYSSSNSSFVPGRRTAAAAAARRRAAFMHLHIACVSATAASANIDRSELVNHLCRASVAMLTSQHSTMKV